MLRLEPKTFMGNQRRNWSSPGLGIDLSEYSAGCTIPKHGHIDAFFCFVLNGTTEERYYGRCDVLLPGSLVYHPAGFEHSGHWPESGRSLHIEFSPDFCDGADKACLSDPMPRFIRGGACDIVKRIYQELLHFDSASGIAFEGLALVLLAETIREASRETKTPRWLRSVRDRLYEENQSVPPLKQIAAETGVHATYLATSFQQHFGISIGAFVRSRRIERSEDLLKHSEQSLSDIACLLGFSDQSHFCRAFKQQTGLSPLKYRRLFSRNQDLIPKP